jgi:hypothetical protein
MGGRAWKLKAAEAVSKPRQSKRNPLQAKTVEEESVGKVSLKGAGAGRAVATSFFFRDGTTAPARKLKKSHWLV